MKLIKRTSFLVALLMNQGIQPYKAYGIDPNRNLSMSGPIQGPVHNGCQPTVQLIDSVLNVLKKHGMLSKIGGALNGGLSYNAPISYNAPSNNISLSNNSPLNSYLNPFKINNSINSNQPINNMNLSAAEFQSILEQYLQAYVRGVEYGRNNLSIKNVNTPINNQNPAIGSADPRAVPGVILPPAVSQNSGLKPHFQNPMPVVNLQEPNPKPLSFNYEENIIKNSPDPRNPVPGGQTLAQQLIEGRGQLRPLNPGQVDPAQENFTMAPKQAIKEPGKIFENPEKFIPFEHTSNMSISGGAGSSGAQVAPIKPALIDLKPRQFKPENESFSNSTKQSQQDILTGEAGLTPAKKTAYIPNSLPAQDYPMQNNPSLIIENEDPSNRMATLNNLSVNKSIKLPTSTARVSQTARPSPLNNLSNYSTNQPSANQNSLTNENDVNPDELLASLGAPLQDPNMNSYKN